MNSWYYVLFHWPDGSVWGNWVDDVVCLTLGFIAGHFGIKWLRRKIDGVKEHLSEQAERHHAERMAQAQAHHEDTVKVHGLLTAIHEKHVGAVPDHLARP